MSSKIQLYNRNGDPICHAYGCRKHKNLIKKYQGIFCDKHIKELTKIRNKIKTSKCLADKIIYRNDEMLFRKIFDENHVMYIRKLEQMNGQ